MTFKSSYFLLCMLLSSSLLGMQLLGKRKFQPITTANELIKAIEEEDSCAPDNAKALFMHANEVEKSAARSYIFEYMRSKFHVKSHQDFLSSLVEAACIDTQFLNEISAYVLDLFPEFIKQHFGLSVIFKAIVPRSSTTTQGKIKALIKENYICLFQNSDDSYISSLIGEINSDLIFFYSKYFNEIIKAPAGGKVLFELIIGQNYIPEIQKLLPNINQHLDSIYGSTRQEVFDKYKNKVGDIVLEEVKPGNFTARLLDVMAKTVGCVDFNYSMCINSANNGFIDILRINPGDRHSGYGTALLAYAKNKLFELGCKKISLTPDAYDLKKEEDPKIMQNKLIDFYKKNGGIYLPTVNTIEFFPAT